MLDIAALRRRQMGTEPEGLLEAAGAALRWPLPHHAPYTQQEPLASLPPGDVPAVLEVMFGRAGGAAAASAVSGRWDEEAPESYWQPAPPAGPAASQGGRGAAAQSAGGASSAGGAAAAQGESLGQVCSCILAKMVVDTWLGAGPAASLPLVLRMLQQGLHHAHPSVRARPFDVIYNLSLHAALLTGCDDEESGDAGTPAARYNDAPPGAGTLAPPSAPPELAGQLYARPQSPSGAQRPRGGSGQQVAQLPSPRIHLPPQVMAQQAAGSGSGASSGGGTSPGSPLSTAAAAAASGGAGMLSSPLQPTPQLQQGLSSPRSRLGRTEAPPSPASSGAAARPGGEGSGSGLGPPGGALESEFDGWLRQLLFELLTMLAQLDEKSEPVWQSAVGCLLHLTTHAGYWVRDSVTGLPPQALRGLLRAARAFDWAPELHGRFSQLVPLLLCPLGGVERRGTTDGGRSDRRRVSGVASDPGGGGGGSGGGSWLGVERRVTAATSGTSSSGSGAHGDRRASAMTEGAGGGGSWEYGGVDARLLAALGGAEELLHHFCHAASPEAQRCLLLPLLEQCMPPGERAGAGLGFGDEIDSAASSAHASQDGRCQPPPCAYHHIYSLNRDAGTTPPAAARAALTLGGSPARLRVLATALWGGRHGLADPIMTALSSAPGFEDQAELQLLCSLILGLEELAAKGTPGAGGHGLPDAATTDSAAAAAAAAQAAGSNGSAEEAALAGAIDLTRLQLLSSSPPALDQQATVASAAAWRALRELCWCDEPGARAAAANWLQQLLSAALDLNLEVIPKDRESERRLPGCPSAMLPT
jgi:hypothetical protein